MKIGVLALQGAFREHAEALDALGADVTLVKAPEHLAGVDAIVLPGGESTTIDKLLDSSRASATPLARRAPRRHARLRDVRGPDRAARPRSSTAAPISSRSACSTSPCAATATAASASRSRPTLDVAEPAPAAAVLGRVHPGARVERVGPGVEVLAEHDGVPVLGRQGAYSVRYVSSRARQATCACTERFVSEWGAECPVTRNGIRSSTRRARPTRSAASSSRSSSARSRSRPARAAATPSRTRRCAAWSRRRATTRCRSTRSSARSSAGPAKKKASSTSRSRTRATRPSGVAVIVQALTDNRNRTSAEIKNIFSRNGGSFAEPGAVSWQFERKGIVARRQGAPTKTS